MNDTKTPPAEDGKLIAALAEVEALLSVQGRLFNVAVPLDTPLGRARLALGNMAHLILPPEDAQPASGGGE